MVSAPAFSHDRDKYCIGRRHAIFIAAAGRQWPRRAAPGENLLLALRVLLYSTASGPGIEASGETRAKLYILCILL